MSALNTSQNPDPKKITPPTLLHAVINAEDLDKPTKAYPLPNAKVLFDQKLVDSLSRIKVTELPEQLLDEDPTRIIQITSTKVKSATNDEIDEATREARTTTIDLNDQTRDAVTLPNEFSGITRVKDLAQLQSFKKSPAVLEGSLAHLDQEILEPTTIILKDSDLIPTKPLAVKLPSTTSPENDLQERTGAETPRAKNSIDGAIEVTKEEFLDFSEFDLVEDNTTLTLEQFLGKKVLFSQDISALLTIIKSNSDNLDVWKFVNKHCADPLDIAILKKNLEKLDQQMLHSIMIGGRITQNFIDQNGQTNTIVMYKGPDLNEQGNMSKIVNVYMYYEDNLTLIPKLLKTPKEERLSKALFEIECVMAQAVLDAVKANPDDKRTSNILIPEYIGNTENGRFLVMPVISNEDHESYSLKNFGKSKKSRRGLGSVSNWIKSLSGMVRGLDFLTEHQIIVSDNKLSNSIDSEHGAKVIDIGGFVSISLEEKGYMGIARMGDQPTVTLTLPDSSHLFGIATTPSYNSIALVEQELVGKVPPGTSHKYSLAKCLEAFFCMAKLASKADFEQKGDQLFDDKDSYSEIPPISLNTDAPPPIIQKLYQLYLKIYTSPNSISLAQIEAELNQISNSSVQI